jgi:hypothetical protein
MITRRDFLVSGITASGAGIIVPPVFAKSVFAATVEGVHNHNVLVILQLGGGNDGLAGAGRARGHGTAPRRATHPTAWRLLTGARAAPRVQPRCGPVA